MSVLSHESKFSKAPVNQLSRSIFDRSNTLVTSFSAGKLVPIFIDEVIPGDTCTMDLSMLLRMSTPIAPVMDNAWCDIHFFFVPNRLIWNNWKYFMGETQDAWDDEIEYEVPRVLCTPGPHTLSGYFGLPQRFAQGNPLWCEANALFFRAYQLVWNEWYRDQNLQDSVFINKGDTDTPAVNVDFLLPVNKYHDYFTSCLPAPQKGVDVAIPGFGSTDLAVYAGAPHSDITIGGKNSPLRFSSLSAGVVNDNFTGNSSLRVGSVTSGSGVLTSTQNGSSGTESGYQLYPANLYAAVSSDGAVGTINDLRVALAVQRLLERDARGGTRYRELVKAHFGVDVGDARVQVPEYLGGAHIPINIMQVVQQSSTAGEPSPLGDVGAMSKTVHQGSLFSKSFTEHGILIGLASVRTDHSYLYGVPRMFDRKTRYDYYWPELANIGEQAVKVREIYAGADPDAVFGYQEAWADYRYKPNMVTGKMAFTSIPNSGDSAPAELSYWHYGDYYAGRPYLSDEWIQETDANVARTLAVTDTEIFDQFIANFYFNARWARPIPLFSIPGLTGHI